MSDQGFQQSRSLNEQLPRATKRDVPICPVALTSTEATVATAPPEQLMKIQQLAVCNTTGSAVTLDLWVTPNGGTKRAQLSGYSVSANGAVDLTGLVGGLYPPRAAISARGEGLILSGWYEAVL